MTGRPLKHDWVPRYPGEGVDDKYQECAVCHCRRNFIGRPGKDRFRYSYTHSSYDPEAHNV